MNPRLESLKAQVEALIPELPVEDLKPLALLLDDDLRRAAWRAHYVAFPKQEAPAPEPPLAAGRRFKPF